MDEAAVLRLKAEACRRLAEIEASDEDKTLWLEHATGWDKLAVQADKRAKASMARRRMSRY